MNIQEIIAHKRDGQTHSFEEIAFMIQGATNGTIPDYQLSAWLMAIFLRGMTHQETIDLTIAMRDSGERVDLSDISTSNQASRSSKSSKSESSTSKYGASYGFSQAPPLDKHSTGGVGDKTTLVVVPALAAAEIPILKMSGRGLGFSGGTVDKLESIPGFRHDYSAAEAKQLLRNSGVALIGQSSSLAPADKILYALRDVTATVECIPLIASSIMSKKLASGAQRLLLDVKVGKGAFMKSQAEAQLLATTLVSIGEATGVPTDALITPMDEPLGRMVGNALEVQEAIQLLMNPQSAEPDFLELCVELIAHGLMLTNRATEPQSARQMAHLLIDSQDATRKFEQIVSAQGGPDGCEAILDSLPSSGYQLPVYSDRSGHIVALDAERIGALSVAMGAGRATKEDQIDHAVGIELISKTGDIANRTLPLAVLHIRPSAVSSGQADEWAETLRRAYTITPAQSPG